MDDITAAEIFERMATCTLPKPEWTHEAHLAACWTALWTMQPDDALDYLRDAIKRYNAATGVANTPTSGYHETITRYFVGAVASLGECPAQRVLETTSCERIAPLRHWSKEILFSKRARRGWVPPDLQPLPWSTPGAT